MAKLTLSPTVTLILTLTQRYVPDVGIYNLETKFSFYNHLHSLSSVVISTDRKKEFKKINKHFWEKNGKHVQKFQYDIRFTVILVTKFFKIQILHETTIYSDTLCNSIELILIN